MSSNKIFININTEQLNDLLNQNTKKIIYIGRPTCPGCVEMEPYLREISRSKKISIYYYNTKKAREEELDEFLKIRSNLRAEYIPLILHYVGNKEIGRLDYNDFVESEHNIDKFIVTAIENN